MLVDNPCSGKKLDFTARGVAASFKFEATFQSCHFNDKRPKARFDRAVGAQNALESVIWCSEYMTLTFFENFFEKIFSIFFGFFLASTEHKSSKNHVFSPLFEPESPAFTCNLTMIAC